jgi:DNA repair protein RadD
VSAPILRPYQATALADVRAALRHHRRVLLVSPTGSGKTVLTARMIQGAQERGLRTWFIVHRRELLQQTCGALWGLGVHHGAIAAGRPRTRDLVQVASVQTLGRRDLATLPAPDLIVVDEAHHATAATYRRVLDAYPEAWVVGLTATPERTDGAGLGDLFDALVMGPTVGELIGAGYLSPYRLVAPPQTVDVGGVRTQRGDYARGELAAVVDRASIVGDAVAHYRRHVGSNPGPPSARSCLVYCVNRAHARHVAEAYVQAGISAAYVAGDTPDAERAEAIAGFRRGSPAVLVSVDLFGEGLDVPGLAAVQLLRPTQSLSLHLQQIGRALRVEDGKPHATVLDHVGNTWRHGLPDDERDWTLEGRRNRKKAAEDPGPALRHCPRCHAIYRASLQACSACGTAAPPAPRTGPEVVEGELVEVDLEARRKLRRREQAQARTLEELVRMAKRDGMKPGWAGAVWAARTGQPKQAAMAQARRIAQTLEAA